MRRGPTYSDRIPLLRRPQPPLAYARNRFSCHLLPFNKDYPNKIRLPIAFAMPMLFEKFALHFLTNHRLNPSFYVFLLDD